MKKLVSKVYNFDIIPPSRFLLLEKLVGSFSYLVLSFPFQFCQFFSNFLKYSFLNFLLYYLYNILAIYFPGSSPLLKLFSSIQSNSSCLLTSVFTLSSNSITNFFIFSKSSSFSQLSCFAVNPFYHTKYFVTPLTFLLFNIFSTSHSSTPSTFIGLTSSFFCSST